MQRYAMITSLQFGWQEKENFNRALITMKTSLAKLARDPHAILNDGARTNIRQAPSHLIQSGAFPEDYVITTALII